MLRAKSKPHGGAQKGSSFHNLQEKKGKAKPYQVAQVRDELKKFNFADRFADALKALDNPDLDIGYDYHDRDLALTGQLSQEAASILRAVQCAWVFGGECTWNDIGFDSRDGSKIDYERVSERLFNALSEAIAAAASSTSELTPEPVKPVPI